MALALRTAGPAIFASALTVIAALLCLSLAEVNGTAGLGPIGAMGIARGDAHDAHAAAGAAGHLRPRAFWRPADRSAASNGVPALRRRAGADETHGIWRRVGERVAAQPAARRGSAPRRCCSSWRSALLNHRHRPDAEPTPSATRSSRSRARSCSPQSFPAGASAPTDVDRPATRPTSRRCTAARRRLDGVAEVAPGAGRAASRQGVLLSAVLEPDPYSTEAYDLIPDLRAAAQARRAAPTCWSAARRRSSTTCARPRRATRG